MIFNILSKIEQRGDWYYFSRFKGPFSDGSHHDVRLLDVVSHREQILSN